MELLAPAGDFEKLEIAVHFGADAVYLAGKRFSLRNFSGNFSDDDLFQAVDYAHTRNTKVYVACNAFIRNHQTAEVADFLLTIRQAKPDGIIIADPGVLHLARRHIPDIPIHLSTQANTTNAQAAMFWRNFNVTRINAARELPLNEIKSIRKSTDMEVEAFGHGAMCIAYSGRCLLSSYLAGRDGNQGMCAHPCRWRYAVVEETRPQQPMPIAEDETGAYIFSSKDLCMIDHIPDMVKAGICAFKIEGRMKGIHYLATVVNTYRKAIDAYYDNPDRYDVKAEWQKELALINHRGYCTGFYFGDPGQTLPSYEKSHTFDRHLFVGKILAPADDRYHLVEVRNKITSEDFVAVLSPSGPVSEDRILEMKNQDNDPLTVSQPGQKVIIRFLKAYQKNDIIRKSISK